MNLIKHKPLPICPSLGRRGSDWTLDRMIVDSIFPRTSTPKHRAEVAK